MIRFAAPAILAATLLGATVAAAQAPTGAYYVATPATAPVKASFLARETVWTQREGVYVARRGDVRDAIQCELAAKQAGKLTAFTAGGTAFDAAALEKCNAKAK